MADTAPSVKKYYDFAQQQVDEQALLDKFNAATTAQFNLQREQNRQAENQFYNQMYNTQQTAMDTIRQSNAAAVSTGASRGVQAAQELSALLGLQQESVASATELANANRQTAQEETAAVLENVLNAYQQAEQQRQDLMSSAIQAESVEVERANAQATLESNEIAREQLEAQKNMAGITSGAGKYNPTPTTDEEYTIALDTFNSNQNNLFTELKDLPLFVGDDWAGSATGKTKANAIRDTIQNICDTYGLNYSDYEEDVKALITKAGEGVSWLSGKGKYADDVNDDLAAIRKRLRDDYAKKAPKKSEAK